MSKLDQYSYVVNFSLLVDYPGFTFEERGREYLPKDFPANIPGTCYFLNSYKHPDLPEESSLDEFIDAALEDIGLSTEEH